MRVQILLLVLVASVQAACFYPNGTQNNDFYQPCGNKGQHSMCCRINDTFPDTCLTDSARLGLCANGDLLWRESCTDPTWQSEGNLADDHVTLRTCDDGSYCCGTNAEAANCCARRHGKFLSKGQVLTTNPLLTSSSTTSSLASPSLSSMTTISTTNSISSQTENIQPQPVKSETPLIAGVVVGGVLGLAIIIAVVWLIMHRRKMEQMRYHTGHGEGYDKYANVSAYNKPAIAVEPSELGVETLFEVGTSGIPYKKTQELST
ncbi:hypothetical protein B0J11DRAFT_564384 [Dendryphion nanum]|uniref:Mid2 domain-containing protein n=1 Tax=Dendryphion nanum TaxID=256645 RepID=A0A9P9ECL1_9PLEO|nr:hypothetical protein B0J11DRAFT_564384 [Dendryphion nanum]